MAKQTNNTPDGLKRRVLDVKAKFRKGQDYTTLYEYEFGPQTKEQKSRIRMVWNLRETDAIITRNLEKIASKKVAA